MTEHELEEDEITPELVEQNQLQVLVKDLEPTKAHFFIEKFSDHVKMAAEWAKKAKNIIVTDENQSVLMSQARVARLFLRDKRLDIENTRKVLKADALKEGQAIDKISNFLKDLITPTELHLERQEKFIEFREKAKAETIRLEVEARIESERISKEKADEEALLKAHAENARLRAESYVKDRLAEIKRKQQEDTERILREENDARLQEERNKTLRIERELQIKKQEEWKKEAEEIRKTENMKKACDRDKLIYLLSQIQEIPIPQGLISREANLVTNTVNNLFNQAVDILKLAIGPSEEE